MDKTLSVRMAESIISYYTPGMMKWNYEHGLVIMSIYEIGIKYERPDFIKWAEEMYDKVISEDGTIAGYDTREYNLDQINAGRLLFDLYKVTEKKKYSIAIETLVDQLNHHPRTKSGIFWHKMIYPWQVWLDGLYMEGPFWTLYGNFEDVANQLIKVASVMKDPKTGLLYHCWDESCGMKWSDDKTGLSPNFWSRSIGWYLMSCLDCLDFAPFTGFEQQKEELRAIVADLLKAVYNFQDTSGLWYQVPDRPEAKGNYLETSGSAMFCYAGFKAAVQGITDKFIKKAEKGMQGIRKMYLKEEDGVFHLGGICSVAGLGGNPYRDGSLKYYFSEPVVSDDFKGTGPFVLACLEEEKAGF